MEKRILKAITGCAILVVMIVASCKKVDTFDNMKVVNYDAEFAIPLFTAKTSFQDILEKFDEDTYVQVGPDDLITVFYKGDVGGRTSEDIIDSLVAHTGSLIPIPFSDTSNVAKFGFELQDSVNIDFAILKNTRLVYTLQHSFEEVVVVEFEIPDLTLNGAPFTFTRTVSAASPPDIPTVTVLPFDTFDLSGYKISPENDSVALHYTAFKTTSQTYDTLPVFIVGILDLDFSYVEGHLGNDIYEMDRDTIVIDFFENWTRGDVYFADPKINLVVDNSFGFPVRSKTNVLDVFTVDGGKLALESPYLNNINIDYPLPSEVGETKTTFFDFNKDNSNIDVILGEGPTAVDYHLDAVANPDNDTLIRGFMTDSSMFSVQVEVELPMYGTATGFEARDTFGINFDNYQEFNDVEFKVISENGIPLDVGLQIFFADEDGIVLDSLFTPQADILEAAPVDGEGIPTTISEKTTFATFEGSRFDNIKTAKMLFMRASFSTVNNGETLVKILSAQEVEIRMGMKIGVGG